MSGEYFISYIVINCSRGNIFHKVTLQIYLNLIFFLVVFTQFLLPIIKKKKKKTSFNSFCFSGRVGIKLELAFFCSGRNGFCPTDRDEIALPVFVNSAFSQIVNTCLFSENKPDTFFSFYKRERYRSKENSLRCIAS